MALSLLSPWGEFSVETALLGSFNAGNLMAALATVLACESSRPEFDAARIVSCASSLQPVTGRMQKISGSWPFTVVVDYAHTPDGLEKALRAVREHCKGRVWVVFGCGGDRDRGKRPVMGAVAEANADMLVLTDDNPRSEISGDIIAEIRAGLTEDAAVHIEPDRRKAIAWALSNAAEGDIVLLAGKGHEDYQEIGGRKFPFNDAEIAGAFLKSRFGGSHD
jgi:UDP-N-acetylmuramoyl-L-alanyl-D-glutamate--2,6-diaminopimelate ligase